MANVYLTSTLIADEAVAILQAINSFIRLGNRRWEGMFIGKDYMPGETINLRQDNYYNVSRGDVITAQSIVEASLPLTIQPLFSVAINYKPTDLQREIADFTEEFIMPAVRAISAQINFAIYAAALVQVAHYTGDITAPLNTLKSIAAVNPLMDTLNMNNYGRNLVIDPYNYYQMVVSSTLQNQFLPSLNKAITIEASLGRLVDFEIFKDTSISPYVTGTQTAGGNRTVTASTSDGATLTVSGFTVGATINAGDSFTLEGVYEWDSVGQKPLAQQKQLVVTAPATVGGATVTLSISPALISTGPRQNYYTPGASPNTVPAGTVLSFLFNDTSGYINNMAFTDRGIALALPPLVAMDSPYSFVSTDPKSGISMRVSKAAQILENQNTLRLDAQMGLSWIPEQAVKLVSSLGM
jgi:hypothetical protein